MAIKVICSCGATAMVNDEHAGRTGQCRVCKAPVTVGQPPPSPFPPPTHDFSKSTSMHIAPSPQPNLAPKPLPSDPLFKRNMFLLRQKHMAINEKYDVSDENGNPILFVERPAHLTRNILALLGGLAAGGAIFTMLGFTYQSIPESIQEGYICFGALIAFVAIIVVYVRLEKKRHVEFYRDESRNMKVLRVMQDKKFEIISATYTVTDAAGKLIGTFRKNFLYDLICKRWECRDHTGSLLFIAREDSIIKSLLRRLFGSLLGLLRLNFEFLEPQSGNVIGVFNRSFTILDRYVLDMSADVAVRIDRRLALTMGVMLDTGERR